MGNKTSKNKKKLKADSVQHDEYGNEVHRYDDDCHEHHGRCRSSSSRSSSDSSFRTRSRSVNNCDRYGNVVVSVQENKPNKKENIRVHVNKHGQNTQHQDPYGAPVVGAPSRVGSKKKKGPKNKGSLKDKFIKKDKSKAKNKKEKKKGSLKDKLVKKDKKKNEIKENFEEKRNMFHSGQDVHNVEFEPIFENQFLPRPNVRPLTLFEKTEQYRLMASQGRAPCDTFEKIHLPPMDYYGNSTRRLLTCGMPEYKSSCPRTKCSN